MFNTDAQVKAAVSYSAWAILKDNFQAKKTAKIFLTKRGSDNVAAIDNNYSFADSDPDIFNQYLGLLTDDDAFFEVNKNAGFPQVGSLAWEQATINPILDVIFRAQYAIQCAALKRANPGWSNTRVRWTAFWHVSKEIIHAGFDICGLTPLFGEPCDLANGVFYLIEGEGVDATMSFASAIPIVGWVSTGAKYANKVVKTAAGIQKSLPYIVNATTGLISFGKRADLRVLLNVTDPLLEAHHIIPWGKSDNILVQRAASASNKPFNGIEATKFRLDTNTGQHANHPAYDILVERDLTAQWNQLVNIFGGAANVPTSAARDALINVQNNIRIVIANNPTSKINDLIW